MGKIGEVTVGRIGCFKSDTIFLPSISDITSDSKRGKDASEGVPGVRPPPHFGGVTKLA